MTNHLVGPPAEVRMTMTITRASTGKTETYDLVGSTTMTPEQLREQGIAVDVLPPASSQPPKE